jgi:hypothetical protein
LIKVAQLKKKLITLKEIVHKILDNDFTVLQMASDKKEEAFRLFQVINDRGTNLTDGGLLRAKTLDILENLPQ